MPPVDGRSERALVWIDGEPTHAVGKSPRFDGQDESVSEALELTAEESAFGSVALACAPAGLLYARVDVMQHPDGRLALSELELMEPSLFLLQSPPAMQRFVRAIAALTRA
jgi:hypothetical protein